MLHQAIESVLAARRVPSEIVVIDQSRSADNALPQDNVRGCEIRYVHSPTSGLSRGRNIGVRMASNDVVVMLDDDMLVQADSLERLIAAHDGPGSRTVANGQVLSAPSQQPGLSQPLYALIELTEFETFRGRQPDQVVYGANVRLTRTVLLEIGGYDERLGAGSRFPGSEDNDLSMRLLDAGCEVRHVPDAVMLHQAWRTRAGRVRLRWNYSKGQGGFYAKHASLRDPYVLKLAVRDARDRLRWAVAATLRSPETTAAELVSLAGLLWGAIEWCARYRIRTHH